MEKSILYTQPNFKTTTLLDKNIFIFGNTGVGKSTIINSLINDSVDFEKLQKPAQVTNNSTGTTQKLTFYFGTNCTYVDTIGFFDRNISENVIYEQLSNFVFKMDLKIHKVFYVLKNGKLKDEDLKMFNLLEYLFSIKIYDFVTLLISFCDDNEYDLEMYKKMNEKDNDLQKLLKKI